MMAADKCSVCLLFKPDSFERVENFFSVLRFIEKNFDFKVYVYYFSTSGYCFFKDFLSERVVFNHIVDYDAVFYRTYYINLFLRSADTEFVGIWDIDVVLPSDQVFKALHMLESGECDFVFPYTDFFLDISSIVKDRFIESLDLDYLISLKHTFAQMYFPNPVGGLYFARLSSYLDIGGENDLFYGWGLEDRDRFLRMDRSNFNVKRVNGVLFHLSHPVSMNSGIMSKVSEFIKLYYT